MPQNVQIEKKRISCPSCQLMRIQGVICHETGCPDSYLYITRECKWCGTNFSPEHRKHFYCDDDCERAYNS